MTTEQHIERLQSHREQCRLALREVEKRGMPEEKQYWYGKLAGINESIVLVQQGNSDDAQ